LNDGTYNKVLKLNVSKSKLFTAFYRFKAADSGKIVIDFDFKTNSYLPQTRIAVAQKNSSLKSLPYKSVVWLSLGYKNKLYYYSQGWKALDVFSLNKWHHLKMIIYVSGNKAGTFDVNIDGGEFEGLGLKWRNQLKPDTDNPLGMLFFQINKNASFKGDEYLMIDNFRVKLLDGDNADGKVKKKAVINKKERLYEGTFYSKVLKQKKNFTAILPKDYNKSSENYPVLYLFHGRGRNERSLFDNPEAKAAFMKAGFITVFPDGDDGWYINSPVRKQDQYNDYIEELMKYVESELRISKDSSKRGLSGWSMGGYGCTMFAEAHSNDFSALAPIIALLDYPRTGLPEGQSYKKEPKRFGNDQTVWEKFNPINNTAKLKGKNILIITGDKCFTLTMNKNFVKKLSESNIPYKFKILKGGHSLSVVIKSIPYIVDFMNEKLK
jgi:S-formylglutathione hydrolase FrmB